MSMPFPDYATPPETPVAIVAADSYAGAAAAAAVALSGARVIERLGFDEVEAYLSSQPVHGVLAIELQGVAVDDHAELLSRFDTLARERIQGVVVALDSDQIDAVAARMLGRHVQLLCDPSVADRAAALAVAAPAAGSALHETTRDERERLQMLNDEVARIAETLARLTRSEDRRPAGVAAPPIGYGGLPDERAPIPAAMVRGTIRARRMRASFFHGELFADPAWDMLLDLFAADLERVRVSVSSLCIAAAVPGTTALRWIGTMLEQDLFERSADPIDRRRAYISLSATAREGMQRYFDAIRRAGLASA